MHRNSIRRCNKARHLISLDSFSLYPYSGYRIIRILMRKFIRELNTGYKQQNGVYYKYMKRYKKLLFHTVLISQGRLISELMELLLLI